MSFNPFCDDKGPTFWQQVVLVAVPALIGGLLPPVVMHLLERGNKAKEEKPSAAEEKKPEDKKA